MKKTLLTLVFLLGTIFGFSQVNLLLDTITIVKTYHNIDEDYNVISMPIQIYFILDKTTRTAKFITKNKVQTLDVVKLIAFNDTKHQYDFSLNFDNEFYVLRLDLDVDLLYLVYYTDKYHWVKIFHIKDEWMSINKKY